MKRRPPPKPPIVETRRRATTAPPAPTASRRASPDKGRIRAWSSDDRGRHGCAEYMKARAAFLQGEREFERQHSPYRWPVHAAIYRVYEGADRYLQRVSTNEAHAAYVQRRDDCARHLAAEGKPR
jgi:hypothetical protein